MLRVGVVGAGYWARNGLRVISDDADSALVAVADRDPDALDGVRSRYPHVGVSTDVARVVEGDDVDAVYIVTPPQSHAELARRALRAGKHVLVEKPFTTDSADAAELLAAGCAQDRTVMVGHTFLYSPPVLKVKELIDEGALGNVFYVDAQRVNLGKYQDSGVLWDLGPHDLSILTYWLGDLPAAVTATGRSFVSERQEDVAFVTLEYPNGVLAQIHLSWLAPTRLRRTTIAGERRMVVYDDTAGAEAVKIFDSGIERTRLPSSFGESQLSYRTGDITIPRLDHREPLASQWAHFVDCCATGETPRSSALQGLVTVRMLEAAQESMRGGRRVEIDWSSLATGVVPTRTVAA